MLNIVRLGTHHSAELKQGKLLFWRKGDDLSPALTLHPEQVKLLIDFLKENEENIEEQKGNEVK
jgi:hypothetical protein